MSILRKPKQVIGRDEYVSLPECGVSDIPARIDTGARTSALWASDIKEHNGELTFVLFDKTSPLFTGTVITAKHYPLIVVASSNGHLQTRYKVQLAIVLGGRRIRTHFTLADRSTQAFPVLIGRNTLRGKFIVDVQHGSPALDKLDQDRYDELQSLL